MIWLSQVLMMMMKWQEMQGSCSTGPPSPRPPPSPPTPGSSLFFRNHWINYSSPGLHSLPVSPALPVGFLTVLVNTCLQSWVLLPSKINLSNVVNIVYFLHEIYVIRDSTHFILHQGKIKWIFHLQTKIQQFWYSLLRLVKYIQQKNNISGKRTGSCINWSLLLKWMVWIETL